MRAFKQNSSWSNRRSYQELKTGLLIFYGLEQNFPSRYLIKERGTAKAEEIRDVKVLEFSDDSKQISVLHTKIMNLLPKAVEIAEKKAAAKDTKEVKKMKDSVKKTTITKQCPGFRKNL